MQSLVDKNIIDDEQAETHSQKNRILKALGVTPNLEPSFSKAKPKNGDIFLICSDGLSGMIPDSTIEKVLGQNTTLEEKGELLINLAMQGETVQPGGQDNCTLELIEIDNSPWPKSEFESFNPSKSEKKNGKKSTSKIVKIIAVIFALIVALGVTGVYVNHNQKKEAIEEEIRKIDKELETINEDISNKVKDKDKYETNKTKAEEDMMSSTKGREAAKKRVKELQTEIDKLNGEISNLNSKKDSLSNKKIELENKLKKTHSK